MTVSEIDIYRTASALIDQHGGDARAHAERRIKELRTADDLEGVAVWQRIRRPIEDLLSTKPSAAKPN